MVATPALTSPIELLAAQVDCEVITLPTGAHVFKAGQRADSIHGLRRGIVELIRDKGEKLDRLRFLNLLHNHPTLAILLIGQQHERLREQRTSGTCCY